jgi:hypothetical protein
VLVVRIVVRSEIVERSRELYRPSPDIIRQGANGCGPPVNDLRKRSLGVRILALLVPWIASCPSGSISASQVGHRSLQRQTHSSHQSVPQGQGTTASVSSSFRSVREGMGDFGIAFLPSGSDLEWFGHRLVRSF